MTKLYGIEADGEVFVANVKSLRADIESAVLAQGSEAWLVDATLHNLYAGRYTLEHPLMIKGTGFYGE